MCASTRRYRALPPASVFVALTGLGEPEYGASPAASAPTTANGRLTEPSAVPLAGLLNRVLLGDRLERASLHALRRPGYWCAILLLDLDGFKAVNDTLGHAAGDTLLVEVARRLTGLLRASDTVARLGGDEFVVLLDGLVEPGWQKVVCDSIRAAITKPFVLDGHEVEVGLSIGVAVSTADSANPDHMLREADAAMYRVKSLAKHR